MSKLINETRLGKNMLFEMWGIRCVVTGVDQKELLIGAILGRFQKVTIVKRLTNIMDYP